MPQQEMNVFLESFIALHTPVLNKSKIGCRPKALKDVTAWHLLCEVVTIALLAAINPQISAEV